MPNRPSFGLFRMMRARAGQEAVETPTSFELYDNEGIAGMPKDPQATPEEPEEDESETT